MIFSANQVPLRLNRLVSLYLHTVRRYSLKTRSHYEVLGVDPKATRKEIKAAFIEKSKKLHPDRNADDPKTHDKFVQLNEAYTALSDPGLKSLYDGRKGFGIYRQSYSNNRPPSYNHGTSQPHQNYYYQHQRYQDMYAQEKKETDNVKGTIMGIILTMVAAYIFFAFIYRKVKNANTINVDLKSWIRNHHEPIAFRDQMYVQRVLTDYFDTLDSGNQQTLRRFPRTTRYQILLEMYEEKMNSEAETRAKAQADEASKNTDHTNSSSDEIQDDSSAEDKTLTLNLIDLSSKSNESRQVHVR